MSSMFKGSVALFAMSAMLALPLSASAQATTEATTGAPAASTPAPAAAPSATTPSIVATELPQVLKDLNLSDLSVKSDKRGQRISGTLADGTKIKAMLDDKAALRGAFVDDNKPLPESLANALIPQSVRDQQIFGQFNSVTGAFSGEKGVMIVGTDAGGDKLRAGFSQDGTLMRFGRGQDSDMRPGGHDRKGPDGHEGRHGGKHDGKHDGKHGDKRGDKHGGRDHHGNKGPRDGRGPAPVSDEAVAAAAKAAGYTDLGVISRDGPRVSVIGKNPQGEPVVIEINPKGDVVRETAQ